MLFLLCILCGAGVMQAQAASTNVISTAKKTSGGTWTETAKGKRYLLKSGSYAKNSWRLIDGRIYYFNKKGYCAKGWFTYGGQTYYATSIYRICYKEWHKIGTSYYYFLKNGNLATDRMVKTSGKYYYVNSSGARVKSSWVEYNGETYYFNASGVRLQKKWLQKKGKYYYFASNGVMARNKWVGDYYVGDDGARLTDCEVDGYYLDETGKKITLTFNGSHIFLGDSRMVGMQNTVSSTDIEFIAKVSMGYSWLDSTAGPMLKSYLKFNPNVKVVLALGVNDLGNIESYITYYQSLIQSYPTTRFYFLAVNPVDEKAEASHGYTIKNSQIRAFNKKLKAAFGTAYLDSYTYLKEAGITTVDGVHYLAETYQTLFDFIMSQTS
jgi:hypothetical protein